MADITQQDLLDLTKCPHCSVAAPLLQRVHHFHYQGVKGGGTKDWSIYMCRSCGLPIAAGGKHGAGGRIDVLIPQPREIDAEIPERPRAYLQQAVDTLHAPSASVMVSASAVDAMLKAKGLTKGTLNARIVEAQKQHLITADMAAWAHDIRLDANDERHADVDSKPVIQADAQRCLDFASALAEYLFVLPARVARGRGESAS